MTSQAFAQTRVKLHKATKRGASALTYGLLVGLISVAALAAVTTSGDEVNGIFVDVQDTLSVATSGSAGGSGGSASPSASASASQPPELYPFTSHTFTTCGATGRTGPSESMCESAYSSESWSSDNNFFTQGSFQGYQLWTVPQNGDYQIQITGADGGQDDGVHGGGYNHSGTFTLTGGDKLTIVVGQPGLNHSDASAGGGGSFVALGSSAASATPLIIAGGGGGRRTHGFCSETNANSTQRTFRKWGMFHDR